MNNATHLLIPIEWINDLQYSIADNANAYGQGQKYILEKIKLKGKQISFNENDIENEASKAVIREGYGKYYWSYQRANNIKKGYKQALKDLLK